MVWLVSSIKVKVLIYSRATNSRSEVVLLWNVMLLQLLCDWTQSGYGVVKVKTVQRLSSRIKRVEKKLHSSSTISEEPSLTRSKLGLSLKKHNFLKHIWHFRAPLLLNLLKRNMVLIPPRGLVSYKKSFPSSEKVGLTTSQTVLY